MRVKNTTERMIPVGRVQIGPGRDEEVPDGPELYQPRVQRLRADGSLIFPYHPPKEEEVEEAAADETKEEPAEEPKPTPSFDFSDEAASDDLTQLVHVGRGRARALNEAGVSTFEEVVAMGAEELDNRLAIDRSMAEAIVEDAKSRL